MAKISGSMKEGIIDEIQAKIDGKFNRNKYRRLSIIELQMVKLQMTLAQLCGQKTSCVIIRR